MIDAPLRGRISQSNSADFPPKLPFDSEQKFRTLCLPWWIEQVNSPQGRVAQLVRARR